MVMYDVPADNGLDCFSFYVSFEQIRAGIK